MSRSLTKHIMREDMPHARYHNSNSCPSQPPSELDQWVLPVTLVSSLVCCVVLFVELVSRFRKTTKKSVERRRRTSSAVTHYSIDDFECLDMGTTNMLLHLQTECNDISAKIDRCAMALVAKGRDMGDDSTNSGPSDTPGLEELALTKEELYEQWDNLICFQQFVDLHMKNAYIYQQYHFKLTEVDLDIQEAFRNLHLLLLQASTDTSGLTDFVKCIEVLHEVAVLLEKLLVESTYIVPVHRRIKFTGRHEALSVRALCDYRKDEFTTSLGEPLKLIWRKNKYTWRVRNTQNVEGDLPAICCLIPGPDLDTMEHAWSLADEFVSQWQSYEQECESKLSLHACTALSKASLNDSHLVVLTDTDRAEARHTLALIERVMTSQPSGCLISEADRKCSRDILHQLYELLNGSAAREETSLFLDELHQCYNIINAFEKQGDLVSMVFKKSDSLNKRIQEEKARKRSNLTRQSSQTDVTSSKSLEARPSYGAEDERRQQPKKRTTCKSAGNGLSISAPNSPRTITQPTGEVAISKDIRIARTDASDEPVSPYSGTVNDGIPSPLSVSQQDTMNQPPYSRSQSVPVVLSKNEAFNKKYPEIAPCDGTWIFATRPTIKGLSGPSAATKPKEVNQPAQRTPEQKHTPGDIKNISSNVGLRKRSTILVSNATTVPGKPRTPTISTRHASMSSSASFGNPSLEVGSTEGLKRPSVGGTETDDEKLRVGTLNRSESVSSNLSTSSAGSRSSRQSAKIGSRLEKSKSSPKRGELKVIPGTSRSPSMNEHSGRSTDKFFNDPTTNPTEAVRPVRPERPKTFGTKFPQLAQRQYTPDAGRYKRPVSISSNSSMTPPTPQSPMSPGYYSCTSSTPSISESVSRDVSLSLSFSSDEEVDEYKRSPVTPEVFGHSSPVEKPYHGTPTSAANNFVPTVNITWSDEHNNSLSKFVSFKKDTKQTFTIGSIRDPTTQKRLPVKEAIEVGLLNITHKLYQPGYRAGNAASISVAEAICNGSILLQASEGDVRGKSRDQGGKPIMSLGSGGGCIINGEDMTSTGADTGSHSRTQLETHDQISSGQKSVKPDKVTVETELADLPVNLMRIVLKRPSQAYIINQVIDPHTKIFIPVQTAIKQGILIWDSKHYRNPLTGENISLDDAFARGLLIVDHRKVSEASFEDNDNSYVVYKGQEGVGITRLIAVFWVKGPGKDNKVSLGEAIKMTLIDVQSGMYRCDGQEIHLADAILQGHIRANVLDNSDIESVIRKSFGNMSKE